MLKISDFSKLRVSILAKFVMNEMADLLNLIREEERTDEDKIPEMAGSLAVLAEAVKRIDEILMPVQFEAESSHSSPIWSRFPKHELN